MTIKADHHPVQLEPSSSGRLSLSLSWHKISLLSILGSSLRLSHALHKAVIDCSFAFADLQEQTETQISQKALP